MFDERLPLFPLGIVLLPGEPVPLHIFEPRYKEMVRVCIDGDRPFGIVYASEEKPADVGCTARIERVAAQQGRRSSFRRASNPRVFPPP